MRTSVLLVAALLLSGCGSSSASTPTPSPTTAVASIPRTAYKSPPPLTINLKHHYTATVETTDGSFTVQLLPQTAPLAVNNFIFLARHNFYNNVIFHRIIQNFMIQTGDPTGTGFGGPGYQFKDELHKHMTYRIGTVAMANHGKNTNGSQFFIVTGPEGESLPPSYSIFGQVLSGMKAVDRIASTPVTVAPGSNDPVPSEPLVDVKINRILIHESA